MPSDEVARAVQRVKHPGETTCRRDAAAFLGQHPGLRVMPPQERNEPSLCFLIHLCNVVGSARFAAHFQVSRKEAPAGRGSGDVVTGGAHGWHHVLQHVAQLRLVHAFRPGRERYISVTSGIRRTFSRMCWISPWSRTSTRKWMRALLEFGTAAVTREADLFMPARTLRTSWSRPGRSTPMISKSTGKISPEGVSQLTFTNRSGCVLRRCRWLGQSIRWPLTTRQRVMFPMTLSTCTGL